MDVGANNLIFAEVQIDGFTLPSYLDTGGSYAFLDRRAYDALKNFSSLVRETVLETSQVASVQCSNGSAQKVHGSFPAKLTIGPIELEGDVKVVEDQPIPLLLGANVMLNSGVGIDYLRRRIFGFPVPGWFNYVAQQSQIRASSSTKQRGRSVAVCQEVSQRADLTTPWSISASAQVDVDEFQSGCKSVTFVDKTREQVSANASSDSRASVVSMVDYTVPAETQQFIWCQLTAPISSATLIEPDDAVMSELGLCAVSVVVVPDAGQVRFLVLNLSAHTVKIQQGRRLAQATTVCECLTLSSSAAIPEKPKLSREAKLEKVLKELKFDEALPEYPAEREQLRQLIDSRLDAFAENDDDIGLVQLVEHSIETGDAPPARARARFYTPTQRAAIKEQVDKYKQIGVVRPSSSPWAAPVVVVRKKDGTNRLCIDYRQLNMVTLPDSFPLPNMRTLFEKLQGAQWFASFDVLMGYHNVPMAADSIPKTAFMANDELLEFIRMPFGLCNAPATFQRMILTALVGLGDLSSTYLDDVLVFSVTLPSIFHRMDLILERIQNAGIRLKPKKCVLPVQEIVYLGFLVSAQGISPIPAKIDLIRRWPVPTNIKELRGFLGFVNRYFAFYPTLAVSTAHLARATSKRTLQWTAEMQQAFDATKELFEQVQTLALPDTTAQFILETDASQVGLGACLLQSKDGVERPVGYYSKALSSAQRNYDAYKLELFALYQAVKHFAVYLAFLPHFLVRTDSQALRFWRTSQFAPGDVRSKWKAYLDPFKFDIVHLPGAANTIADAISRAPDAVQSTQLKPMSVKLFQSQVSRACYQPSVDPRTSSSAALASQPSTFFELDDLQGSYGPDHRLVVAILDGATVPEDRIHGGSVELKELYGHRHELEVKNGLIYKSSAGRLLLYVPEKKRQAVLEVAHSTAHQSPAKMFAALRLRLWWPSIRRDIVRHVAVCRDCLRTRDAPKTPPHTPLVLFRAAARFELVHVDIMGGRTFPVTRTGKKYILVAIDHFTRFCVAVPMADQTAETVAAAFVQHWVWRFGVPMRVHTDQGANFESTLFAEMCQRLHIAKSHTLTYRPQSNGAVERVNRTLISLLRTLVCDQPKQWDLYLQQAVFAYNATPHRATGVSPYFLVHGEEARLPVELIMGSPSESQPLTEFSQTLVQRMQVASEAARVASNRAQRLAKDYYDANVHNRLYKTGDVVYRQVGQFKEGVSRKMAPKWIGPCIVRSVRNVHIVVVDPNGRLQSVHHNRLSAPVPPPGPLSNKRSPRASPPISKPAAQIPANEEEDSEDSDQVQVTISRQPMPIARELIGVELVPDLPDSDDDDEHTSVQQPVATPTPRASPTRAQPRSVEGGGVVVLPAGPAAVTADENAIESDEDDEGETEEEEPIVRRRGRPRNMTRTFTPREQPSSPVLRRSERVRKSPERYGFSGLSLVEVQTTTVEARCRRLNQASFSRGMAKCGRFN